ncbi:zinc-ribbon domain-containing protein [bacterium]|nr:zinc-ribbon domain-containing protein [bacterium]
MNIQTERSLQYKYPEIAKRWDFNKNLLTPKEITYGTNKKYWWLCEKKHSYESRPMHMIITYEKNDNSLPKEKNGCPYCSNQKTGYGNDFKSNKPQIAKLWNYKKNKLDPSTLPIHSKEKVWWICQKKHEFEATISDMSLKKNELCPYCSGRKIGYGNDLKTLFPELMKQWDFKKNDKNPNQLSKGSSKKAWWICDKSHSYEASIVDKTASNSGCPYCRGLSVGYGNDLETNFPEIAKDWDNEKNLLKPSQVTPKSGKKGWWKCSYGHSYEMTISQKTPQKNGKMGYGCPFCSGKRIGYGNDLKSLYPEIAREWDSYKNKTKSDEVSAYSHTKVFWKCSLKKHSYKATIKHRTLSNSGCPFCSGRMASEESNLIIEYPEIAKEWDYNKNKTTPEKVNSGSQKKYWWVCPYGHSFLQHPNHRTASNAGCPYCVLTPRSREEIYLLYELKLFFNIDENDHKIKLDKVVDVDIKIPSEKIVIEYDGSYWHKDKAEVDKVKTSKLKKDGWTVLRVREKPLRILNSKYNVHSKSRDYKNTSNKVLQKLSNLGFDLLNLDSYLKKEELQNKKLADKFMNKILKEKNKK